MLEVFRSEKGVERPDSLKGRDFLIILHRASIFSSCFA